MDSFLKKIIGERYEHRVVNYAEAFSKKAQDLQMVAEEPAPYGTKKED
ncbi:hypothetical protein [Treponema phagedenis]|uniref:Uncharacterized protein n=1 Tax=Treponema phagedenis TaxID=162 RepID=A0A0B7GX75_TREPH|nr:hypothetical protein [Treponema phagedenis]NVP23108.1 hypothetical protein [Treponema phagedenis]QKS92278.1 hypothetical protein HPJ96_06765 [Treponema phagedenis]QLC57976.1 hypothetical protein HW453_03520 [Treponema phagedenis]CEM61510.1 hypothetical protein TPHV1_20047 [Treponema phagedenis]